MIDQETLKALLRYCPETGIFTSNVDRHKWKAGKAVGSLSIYGYIVIMIDGKNYGAHRLAFLYMTGSWPEQTDHINHIRDDNRWKNLREVTHQENLKNLKKRKDNKSGVTGVCWAAKDKRWLARINVGKKAINLGQYKSFEKAKSVREMAEILYGFHKNHGR